ncbi:hypothetical protein M0R45_013063 [Rubus argutus]|uniref:Uncharacterized protein n=1 Tax=Rubus argutus TaxID=59490 RepID=A0AAW1XH78_RUBAR
MAASASPKLHRKDSTSCYYTKAPTTHGFSPHRTYSLFNNTTAALFEPSSNSTLPLLRNSPATSIISTQGSLITVLCSYQHLRSSHETPHTPRATTTSPKQPLQFTINQSHRITSYCHTESPNPISNAAASLTKPHASPDYFGHLCLSRRSLSQPQQRRRTQQLQSSPILQLNTHGSQQSPIHLFKLITIVPAHSNSKQPSTAVGAPLNHH